LQALLVAEHQNGLRPNAAERALRAVALGCKNYLFAGSDAGGEWAARIYSLIGSANSTEWIPKRI